MLQPATAEPAAAIGPANAAVPVAPAILALLPQRLLATWLDSHLRLTELAFEIARLELGEAEEAAGDALTLATQLAEEADPARRAELQLAHARHTSERALARGEARLARVLRAQTELTDLLVDRVRSLADEVRSLAPPAGPDPA
jgi:hypothetical protein